jgi:MYXO-CTERM domain-containing protein
LPAQHTLVLKNSASAVAVIRIRGGASLHYANKVFLDMSASPDGAFVFVSDYGGERIGYGEPLDQSYVHRLEVAAGTWEVKKAYIAGYIEAVSTDTFLLQSLDQWVNFTLGSWRAGEQVTQLGSASLFVYSGNFEYDRRTGRILHGNSGLSSQEITAFKIVGTQFVAQESSGTYGSASGHGGTTVLATDGSAFYYGRLSVDALDVSHNLRVFSEEIHAATADLAFGNGRYFDADTGAALGDLGFSTTVYGLNPNGCDFWTYDGAANVLRHYVRSTRADAQAGSSCVGTPLDAGPVDAGADALLDAGVEAGFDAGADALLDASAEAGSDAGADAAPRADASSAPDAAGTADAAEDREPDRQDGLVADGAVGSLDAGPDSGKIDAASAGPIADAARSDGPVAPPDAASGNERPSTGGGCACATTGPRNGPYDVALLGMLAAALARRASRRRAARARD